MATTARISTAVAKSLRAMPSPPLLGAQSASHRPLHRLPRRALPSGARRARRRVLHARRVERRPPAALVISRELEIVALARHADDDVADPSPRVEPGPERPERPVVRRTREP